MEFAYVTRAESTSNLTTYTFSSQSLGAEHANRKIIVACSGRRATAQGEVSTVTVGGVSATLAVTRVSANDVVALFCASVPTGTTGDVVVTYATDQTESAIAIYRATNISTTKTSSGSEVNEDPLSATIASIPANSILVGVAMVNTSATATWTGATEDYDDTTEAASVFGASTTISNAQTNYTLSCDHSVLDSNGPVMVWAVYKFLTTSGSPMFFSSGLTIG
jgi:hypothetical protein